MTDLDKLIEAVERGDDDFIRSDDWINAWQSFYPQPDSERSNGTACLLVAWKAYHGSLDAAKALHEALLPGWIVHDFSQNSRSMGWSMVICNEAGVYHTSHEGGEVGFVPVAARAWLLAVLKAYRSTQG